MKVIIDIPKEEYDIIRNYKSFMSWTEGLIKKGVAIPEGATNGDMIKAMFPNAKTWEITVVNITYVCVAFEGMLEIKKFTLDWWNAPCKKSEGVNETI